MVVTHILTCYLLASGLLTSEFTTINGELAKVLIPGSTVKSSDLVIRD